MSTTTLTSATLAPPAPAATLAVPETLDPLRFPLRGSRLIEASAGTGKTFTIATLYVRLVLGHGHPDTDLHQRGQIPFDWREDADLGEEAENKGSDPNYPRSFTPPEILVVTFTEAATQELRERIRSRLSEAAGYFRADVACIAEGPAGEDPLRDLRASYPPDDWPACARKLQLAAEWMDEAAVSTIHAWCNRMLREHAFDSDSLFTQTLETDQSELLAEVVRDYWRTFMVPLEADAVGEVRRWWPEPGVLQGALRGLVDHVDQFDEAPAPAQSLKTARAALERRLAELKAPWSTWADELHALLDGAVAAKQVNGHKLQSRFYSPWLRALRLWSEDPQAIRPDLEAKSTAWTRLTPQGLQEAWKGGAPPLHPALEAMLNLPTDLSSLPDARVAILRHAAPWVARRFAAEQDRRAQMGFNDLLTRLADALEGPNGPRLADIIRRQFPVALIDEFQDTDPVQYRIFDAVYRVEANDPTTLLVLIGDPKQAIYAFRGADIYTYLGARRACAGRLYTLKKNYRSTQAMVAAANRCFSVAEARPTGSGAFLFRGAKENPVPFIVADARGRSDLLHADGQTLPALTAWWLPPPDTGTIGKEAYRDQIADACASEMVRLLNLGQAGRAGFAPINDTAKLRKLCPADLAVLVNKRTEADIIRRALARRGVRSVYLSDQDSVFQSPQAIELQHWLAACAEPDDPRLLRAALATATLGLSWAELERLNQDELAWEGCVLQFRDYRDIWRRQGVLPMLRRLLNDFRVPAHLLGTAIKGSAIKGSVPFFRPAEIKSIAQHLDDPFVGSLCERGGEKGTDPFFEGERILTDLLHLAELLQQTSSTLDGEHALIRHLAEQCRDAGRGAGGDARQIRLESDADLVRVVTVHKAKGLEYPLVFLPFAADYRPAKAEDLPLKWHDDQGQPRLALAAEGDVLERADRERLGEDLRKLYVALTRARYATWVGLAPLKELERGAFGYLLGGGDALPPEGLAPALEALGGDCANIAVVPAPAPSAERFEALGVAVGQGMARESRRVVREPWWIASYSALRTVATQDDPGMGSEPSEPGLAEPDRTAPGQIAPVAKVAGHTEAGWPGMGRTGPGRPAPTAETPAEDRFQEMLAARMATEAEVAPLPPPVTPAEPLAGTRAGRAGSQVATPAPGSPHAFPRGPEAGSFLHDLLEWAATQGFAEVAADPVRLRDTVARRCQLRGWDPWIGPLTDWLGQLITQPLRLPALGGAPPTAFSLAGLTTAVPEMEFWLAVHRVDAQAIDRLVTGHTLGGAPRPPLQPARLNGMLKGFMDLVFAHQGRYYVADYKSNWLGADATAYTAEVMRAEILHARYELQYVLYLFALHRLLKARLPDYDYDRHVGGAVYLFLRGIEAPSQGLHAERPPRALIEALDIQFARPAGEVVA